MAAAARLLAAANEMNFNLICSRQIQFHFILLHSISDITAANKLKLNAIQQIAI